MTPERRRILAWANAGARFPRESLDAETKLELKAMVDEGLVEYDRDLADDTITFIETDDGYTLAVKTFTSITEASSPIMRHALYLKDAIF